MPNTVLENISKSFEKKRPWFAVGDQMSVAVRLKEGDKERIQVFRGVVISKQPKSGKGSSATFTVRKVSEGVGVERIFPLHSPYIEKIVVESSSKVRRSRLYYLRNLRGKKSRLKEAERFGDLIAPEKPEGEPPVPIQVETAAPVEATLTKLEMSAEPQKAPPKQVPKPEGKS